MDLTYLDAGLLILAVVFGCNGYRSGFLVGVLSVIGLAVGAVIGTRIGPMILEGGSHSQYAPMFGLVGAAAVAMMLASGLEGLGRMLREKAIGEGEWQRHADGSAGALLGVILGLGLIWISAAIIAQMPQFRSARIHIQESVILQELNELLPPSGPILNALSRFDPLQKIAGPIPNTTPPNPSIGKTPGIRAAAKSVVKVTGEACGLGVEGSGWIATPTYVVTNAHVVAGEARTYVEGGAEGRKRRAIVVFFDSENDIAVLRVRGLRGPALAIVEEPKRDTAGAILGYPEDGPYNVQPSRIGDTVNVRTDDIYGQGPLHRDVTSFVGLVRHGNSGGPIVDTKGRVLTTVFSQAIGTDRPGGYGVPNDLVTQALAQSTSQAVQTGACAP